MTLAQKILEEIDSSQKDDFFSVWKAISSGVLAWLGKLRWRGQVSGICTPLPPASPSPFSVLVEGKILQTAGDIDVLANLFVAKVQGKTQNDWSWLNAISEYLSLKQVLVNGTFGGCTLQGIGQIQTSPFVPPFPSLSNPSSRDDVWEDIARFIESAVKTKCKALVQVQGVCPCGTFQGSGVLSPQSEW